MAEISLRAYVKELDDLIEHEQLDEAIAHCRHILQTYPKHLDVYRLLGKSYLEAKRYGDAADIFQRVLSAMPDDFVAHIGMAIVREDEGNLDAAIWHMERAFETNPSNPAIQQELRRLIGRRDGLEPHKVRLTRGALARMYAHGELYPQAIAELRSALQEDPDRPDLQVLLAEMYWRTNQRTEAAEVGQRILESLPFCREANRIMAAALQSGGQAEEAVTYHRRLASLDPYSALVESAMDDASRVEANAVRIDKLAWVPGQPVAGGDGGQPEWAASLGVDVRAASPRPAAAKRPSWLEGLESETAASRKIESAPPQASPAETSPPAYQPPTASAPAIPGEASGAEREIPDWMRSAGWSEGKGAALEAPVSFSDSELASLEAGTLPPEEGELAPADIPDWLKDIAPAEGLPEAEPSAEATPPAEEAGWLGAGASVSSDEEAPRLPPGWATPSPAPAPTAQESERPAEELGAPPSSVPTWMEEEAPGATSTIVTWLGDRSKEALGRGRRADTPAPEQEPGATPEAEPDFFKESLPEGVPDWLTDEVSWESPSSPVPSESKEADPGRPAWLTGVAAAAAEGEGIRPEELPWPSTESGLQPPVGMYADDAAEPAPPAAEIPDWIRAIADSDFASEAPASASADASPASEAPEGPDWLRQGQELPASSQVLDWGGDTGEQRTDAPEERLRPPPSDDESTAGAPKESLAWLRELAESEPPSPTASGEGPEEQTSPSWLRGSGEDRPLRAALGRSSAPEWLRGIAEPEPEPSEQLSDEGTLDWMRGIAEGEAEQPSRPGVPAVPSPTEPMRAAIEPESNLDWVSTSGAEGGPASTTTGEWLRRLKEEGTDTEIAAPPPTQQAAAAIPAASEDALDDEQVFQWLEGLAARQGVDQPQTKTPREDLPTEMPVVTRPSVTGPAGNLPEEPAQGLEWLEQLASERGLETQASKAPSTSPVSAAPKPVPPPASPEVPDWLRELVAEAGQPDPELGTAASPPSTAPELPPAAETLPALPDWMLTSSKEETEPAFPLPPVPQSPKERETFEIPSPRELPRTEAPTPIEELSEGWVPPWESLELEDQEEPARPAEPALPSIGPTDETIYVPSRRASEDETIFRRPLPAQEPAHTAFRPSPVEPPAPALPPAVSSSATSGVEDEIPDWLQTPMPYVPPRTRPPAPAPTFREPQPAEEIEPVSSAAPPPSAPPPVVLETASRPVTPIRPAWSPSERLVAQPPAAPIPAPAAASPLEAPAIPEAPPLPLIPAHEPKPMMEPAPAFAPPRSAERRVEPIPPAIAPAIPVVKPPARAPRTGRTSADPSQLLDAARKALATGDYLKAATSYGTLIKRNIEVQAITEELRLALDRNPKTPSLWQTLGDAYMKRERLQDAIEAYRRGMESA